MSDTALFVFDLETIPDTSVVRNLCELGPLDTENPILRSKLEEYHLGITDGKNSFPRQLFHQIVSLSFVVADIEHNEHGEIYQLKEIRSGGTLDSTESDIIRGCNNFLGKKNYRLVTFNGRTFDIPVLKYRAMKHHIAMPWLHNQKYSYRYQKDWNCDLLDVLSDFNRSAPVKLKEVCSLLNIPCKYDTSGADVSSLYDQGKIQEIRNYCEIDALVTYIIYLRYSQHIGTLPIINYHQCINDIFVYIKEHQDHKGHLMDFAKLWLKADTTLEVIL